MKDQVKDRVMHWEPYVIWNNYKQETLPWIDAFIEEVDSSFDHFLASFFIICTTLFRKEKKERKKWEKGHSGGGFGTCRSHIGARSFYGWLWTRGSPHQFPTLQISHFHLVPFATATKLSFTCCVIALEPPPCGFISLRPNTTVPSSLPPYGTGSSPIFSTLGLGFTPMIKMLFYSLPRFGYCGRIEKVGCVMDVAFPPKECFIVWLLLLMIMGELLRWKTLLLPPLYATFRGVSTGTNPLRSFTCAPSHPLRTSSLPSCRFFHAFRFTRVLTPSSCSVFSIYQIFTSFIHTKTSH